MEIATENLEVARIMAATELLKVVYAEMKPARARDNNFRGQVRAVAAAYQTLLKAVSEPVAEPLPAAQPKKATASRRAGRSSRAGK